MNLEGKSAIVTGASRGIGRAIALELARCGAGVAVLYAGSEAAAQEVAAQVAALGQKAAAYQCDVKSGQACEETVAAALRHFGDVDILVNNAGITRDRLGMNMTEEEYDEVLDTNLKGAFHMIRQLYRHFSRRRGGRIINISSVAGLGGNAGQANYAAAKAGMIGLTKSIARELAGRGVTCNAVAPGFIDTEMTRAMPEKAREKAMAAIPAARMGEAEEVAKLCAFLASDDAGYITGEVIRCDGGLAM